MISVLVGALVRVPCGRSNTHDGAALNLFRAVRHNNSIPSAGEGASLEFSLQYFDGGYPSGRSRSNEWTPLIWGDLIVSHAAKIHVYVTSDDGRDYYHLHARALPPADAPWAPAGGAFGASLTFRRGGPHLIEVSWVVEAGALGLCTTEAVMHAHGVGPERSRNYPMLVDGWKLGVRGGAAGGPPRSGLLPQRAIACPHAVADADWSYAGAYELGEISACRCQPADGGSACAAVCATGSGCVVATLAWLSFEAHQPPQQLAASAWPAGECLGLRLEFADAPTGEPVRDFGEYLGAAAHVLVVPLDSEGGGVARAAHAHAYPGAARAPTSKVLCENVEYDGTWPPPPLPLTFGPNVSALLRLPTGARGEPPPSTWRIYFNMRRADNLYVAAFEWGKRDETSAPIAVAASEAPASLPGAASEAPASLPTGVYPGARGPDRPGGCAALRPSASLTSGGAALTIRPPSCDGSAPPGGDLGGLARQECVGRSLAALLTPTPSAPAAEPPADAAAAVCIGRALVASRAIDDCHLVAHAIGRAVWKREARTLAAGGDDDAAALLGVARRSLAQCVGGCIDGCIHAVLAEMTCAAVTRAGESIGVVPAATRELLATLFSSICEDREPKKVYACHHGLGHGLGAATDRGLLWLASAFSLCSATPSEPRCLNGVIMEVVDRRVLGSFGRIDAGIADAPADGAALVSVCVSFANAAAMHGRPRAPTVALCANALGEALAFATCHDGRAAADACAGLGFADGPDRTTCVASALREARYVASRLGAGAGQASVECGEGAAELLRVRACDAGAAGGSGAACCGDGRCEWAEDAASCPSDCAPSSATLLGGDGTSNRHSWGPADSLRAEDDARRIPSKKEAPKPWG